MDVNSEKLFEHLEVHADLGQSPLSEDEVLEQFNSTKSDEASRMSSKS